MTGHSLIETYLTDTQAIEMLQHSVNQAFIELQRPDMEDYLFQVTYNYTPAFSKSHASPEILFIDNPSDDWQHRADPYSDDSYLKKNRHSNKFELNPVHALKFLSYQHDKTNRDNQTFTIDQCSDIPNSDPFIIGERSEVIIRYPYYAQPANTKVVVTVRDRYGLKLQSGEQNISELRPFGWYYAAIFLDIKANNPNSAEEKTYIKQQNLETQYELESNSIMLPTTS